MPKKLKDFLDLLDNEPPRPEDPPAIKEFRQQMKQQDYINNPIMNAGLVNPYTKPLSKTASIFSNVTWSAAPLSALLGGTLGTAMGAAERTEHPYYAGRSRWRQRVENMLRGGLSSALISGAGGALFDIGRSSASK